MGYQFRFLLYGNDLLPFGRVLDFQDNIGIGQDVRDPDRIRRPVVFI